MVAGHLTYHADHPSSIRRGEAFVIGEEVRRTTSRPGHRVRPAWII
jgi:hypothetical protein